MTCQPVPSLSAKGSITGCSFSGSAMGPTMPASAEAASPNPACFIRTDPWSELRENFANPPRPPGTKAPFPHCEYVKVHSGCGECHPGKRPPATGCTQSIVPRLRKPSRIQPVESPSSTWRKPGLGSLSTSTKTGRRVKHRRQPLEGLAKSHGSPPPAGKSEPTGRLERTNLAVGRIGPPNAALGQIADASSPRGHRLPSSAFGSGHSANRRRVYEETHVDFGCGSARARFDGVVGECPAARRRPHAAPERHADRQAGGVSRLWRALRAGLRLDLRPLRPLLVPRLYVVKRPSLASDVLMRGRP